MAPTGRRDAPRAAVAAIEADPDGESRGPVDGDSRPAARRSRPERPPPRPQGRLTVRADPPVAVGSSAMTHPRSRRSRRAYLWIAALVVAVAWAAVVGFAHLRAAEKRARPSRAITPTEFPIPSPSPPLDLDPLMTEPVRV